MQLTPEIKAQLEAQKAQCIFCKLISGEMSAKTVFSDDVVIAMLDIYPGCKGHTLVMLKEHYPIMPYIPSEEFAHYFGLLPQLSAAVMKSTVSTAINVFIANGGVAGQQSPHFLLHLLPRETGDGFLHFLFGKKVSTATDKVNMLKNNLPIMLQNHFARNPAPWHTGVGARPNWLVPSGEVIYEDEQVLACIPEKGAVEGHIEIYSKQQEKDFTKLSIAESAHLFYVASFAATAVFEGLGAQGTNIILKSGISDDNPDGKLILHVLPRRQGDGLEKLHWQPQQPSYNLDEVMEKIRDKAWQVNYVLEKPVKPVEVSLVDDNEIDAAILALQKGK